MAVAQSSGSSHTWERKGQSSPSPLCALGLSPPWSCKRRGCRGHQLHLLPRPVRGSIGARRSEPSIVHCSQRLIQTAQFLLLHPVLDPFSCWFHYADDEVQLESQINCFPPC